MATLGGLDLLAAQPSRFALAGPALIAAIQSLSPQASSLGMASIAAGIS